MLYGHSGLQALVDNYLVAAMQIGNFLDYIQSRQPDHHPRRPLGHHPVFSLASRLSSSYPDISGIVLTGGLDLSSNVHKPHRGLDRRAGAGAGLPKGHTYQTVQQLNSLYGRIEANDTAAHRHRARRLSPSTST